MQKSFRVPDGFADEKCINATKLVMGFMDSQIMKYRIDTRKYKRYAEIHSALEHMLEKPNACSVFSIISELSSLHCNFPVKSPMVIKRVNDYFDMQIGAYCLSERRYRNQIKGYPYKSTNIVDLLDEVEKVRQERYENGLSRQIYNGR